MAKLYDEDDLIGDEMKVFDMDVDSDKEDAGVKPKKQVKKVEKQKVKTTQGDKIGKLVSYHTI